MPHPNVVSSKPNDLVTNPRIKPIPLCQSYDHYVHQIPPSGAEDHYLKEIPLVVQSDPAARRGTEETAIPVTLKKF